MKQTAPKKNARARRNRHAPSDRQPRQAPSALASPSDRASLEAGAGSDQTVTIGVPHGKEDVTIPGSLHEKQVTDTPRKGEPTLILEATLYTLDQLKNTPIAVPQLAFVGRSNVGKSSLLNALARRRNLAKISSTPGKTRSVNLFKVDPDGFFLTDLPGYGYAKRGKEERKAWGKLIETYLVSTAALRAVVLLLDCRLPPQESDKTMAEFARAHAIPLFAVLTKADKCNQRERSARQKEWAFFLRGQMALPVSSRTGLGIPDLWRELRLLADLPGRIPTLFPGNPADDDV